ncbi:MAG: HlyD family type I secretion periplasmic adaptor subunit [Gammaproteobacteria bacterium]|nr:HlyD family type I secretion periplasmic adaptor subunit [Gammaproteobacteria bacterium]
MKLRALKSGFSRRVPTEPSEEDFRPAALALLARPPSPIGRLLMMELVALMLVALLWMVIGKVDIHAVAIGSLVPVGQSKVIRAPRLGVVRELLVKEGERVAAGQPLAALDADEERARMRSAALEIGSLRQEEKRLLALLAAIDETEAGRLASPEEGLRAIGREAFDAALAGLRSSQAVLLQRRERQQHALQVAQSELAGLIERRSLLAQQREALARLFEQQLVAEQEFARIRLEHVESGHNVAAARGRLQMQQAALGETGHELTRLLSEQREKWLAQLTEIRLRRAKLALEHDRLELRIADLLLRAPVDGSVEQLQIHAAGAVVDAAQPLMKLVPWPHLLEVEARLSDRDAGFVAVGQEAKIKVDAFPYTRFGTLQGVVSSVAAESTSDGSGASSYRLRVGLAPQRLTPRGEPQTLLPGMRVSVEIRTGERRLIEFFLAPILRYRDESLHER